jgi:hypothetical protein
MSDKDQNATFKKALAIHGELLNELRLIFIFYLTNRVDIFIKFN